MTWFQWRSIAICVALNLIDGFDVLVMAFTAKPVSTQWQLTPSSTGLLLSAGLVGLAAGSLFVAPRADRVGRRPIIMTCLALAGVGMLLSAAAQSTVQLGLLRVITGIGLGGVLACSNVIASEYASRRWRGMAVSLQATGYALGATLGGVLAAALIGQFGWRSVFLVGGVATFLVLALACVWLPESLDYLLTRRRPSSLPRINAMARRLGHPPIESLPPLPPGDAVPARAGLPALLSPDHRRSTLVIWTAFFLVMSAFYFVTSWTPTLLTDAGLSATGGITGGVLLNVGGIFGALAFGVLTTRLRLRTVVVSYLLISAVLLTMFISTAHNLALLLVIGALIGLFLNGSIGGLYAITPSSYDAAVRATATGAAIGVGRIGAILAPVTAGAVLDHGWTPQAVYVAVAVLILAAAVLLLLLRPPLAPLPKARPDTPRLSRTPVNDPQDSKDHFMPDLDSPHNGVSSATVHEAAGRRGALPSRIKPISDAMYVNAPAFTIRLAPGDNLGLHRAIRAAAPGQVLVADTGGQLEYGYWGEILNEAAMAGKLAGLVIDGGVRDVEHLRTAGLPVFAAGICIRGTVKDPSSAISLATTIQIGDVPVRPGDLVVGDVDGVVVIPAAETDDVLRASVDRDTHEEAVISRVRAGESTIEIYGLEP